MLSRMTVSLTVLSLPAAGGGEAIPFGIALGNCREEIASSLRSSQRQTGLCEQRPVAVEGAQDLVAALGRDFEHRAVDAGLPVFAARRLVARGAAPRSR